MREYYVQNDTRANVITYLVKSYILKSSPKYTCYTTYISSDLSRMSVIFTEFTFFPGDVSETPIPLHSTELQLILHYECHHNCKECRSVCHTSGTLLEKGAAPQPKGRLHLLCEELSPHCRAD